MSTDSRPFLAAALIVRDEAEALPGCLESLAGFVDEVHVHDTGSVDGTPDIAAAFGATVTHGPWTDDFAAARNAAQAGWSAEWVLVIDADTRLVADASALRGLLARAPADVLRAEIDNVHDETPYTHEVIALYRPDAVAWTGRVHERLVRHDGTAARMGTAPRTALFLHHLGYATPQVRAAKSVRNAVLAQATLDELARQGNRADPGLVARTLLDLGRSLAGADRRQEAVDAFETLRELFPGTAEWLQGTDFLARLVLAAGLDEVCLVLVEQLRAAEAAPAYCDWLAAQALAQLGDADGAHRLLSGVTAVVDTAGRRHDPRGLDELRRLVDRLRRVRAAAPSAG